MCQAFSERILKTYPILNYHSGLNKNTQNLGECKVTLTLMPEGWPKLIAVCYVMGMMFT